MIIPGVVAFNDVIDVSAPYDGPDPADSLIWGDFVNNAWSLENVAQPDDWFLGYMMSQESGTAPHGVGGLIMDPGQTASFLAGTVLGYGMGPSGAGFSLFIDATIDVMGGTLYAMARDQATYGGGDWFFEIELEAGLVTAHERKVNHATSAIIYERTAAVSLATAEPFDLRLACTLANDRLALSVNGSSVVEDTTAITANTVANYARFGAPASDLLGAYTTCDVTGNVHSYLVWNSLKANALLPGYSL